MATFRKLKSGRWQVIVRKPGYSKIYKTFLNKLLAQRWARDTEVKIEQGKFQDYFEAQNILLKDLIQKYINENVIRQKAKKSTTHKLNFLARQSFANLNLLQIKPKHILDFKNNLDQTRSPKTVNY